MRNASILSMIASIHPEAWDAIIPRSFRVRALADLAALNPQPLPPEPPPDIVFAAAEMANVVVRLAIEAEIRGESSADFLAVWVDEWCGTPWPRKWPWPGPGPRPDEIVGPRPEPWNIYTGRLVGALVLASVGSRLGETDLKDELLGGAEKLLEASVPG